MGYLKLRNQTIKATKNNKYLGFYLDRDLPFNKHTSDRVVKATCMNMLRYSKLNADNRVTLNIKIQFYKQIIKPILQ